MTEDEQRAVVVAEARSWLGTNYMHRGRVKGKTGGVDCAQLVYLVFFNTDFCGEMPLTEYTPDFFMHRGVEKYMDTVISACREVPYPGAGDIALFKMGRIFGHGGIVTQWPEIIHVSREAHCVIAENVNTGRLAGREVKFFSRW